MTKRLGRGLADLIKTSPDQVSSNTSTDATKSASSFVSLRMDQIRPGRYQPRTEIQDQELTELTASIMRQGVLEPVLVRPLAHGTYELVAGERRWRAAKQAKLKEIPAVIKVLTDQQTLECGLIENIQRNDLNPIDEAKGYERLIEEFEYTQEDVAAAVSKDRSTVTNLLRVLKLPREIQQGLKQEQVSLGHAKVLLGIESPMRQVELFTLCTQQHLSVRQLENLIKTWQEPGKSKKGKTKTQDAQIQAVENSLQQSLGTKVNLVSRRKGGRIVIDYYSNEDLSRLIRLLGVNDGE